MSFFRWFSAYRRASYDSLPGQSDQRAQAVVEIGAALAAGIHPQHQLVGLIAGVLPHGGALAVAVELAVLLQHQVAQAVVLVLPPRLAVHLVGPGDAVQGVVGIGVLRGGLAGAVIVVQIFNLYDVYCAMSIP